MKAFTFLFLFILSSLNLNAQDPKPPRQIYFFLGIGFPLTKVRDQAHSPLKYQGWTPTFRIGHEEITENHVSRISVSGSFGSATPKSRPKPKQNLSNLDISNIHVNYAYYHRRGAYDTEGWNNYLGGAITFTFDVRNYSLPSNNLMGYQTNLSLNVGTFVQKKLSDTWRFNYEAFTPIISYSLRPTYLGMLPMKNSDFNAKNVFSNGKVVTVNKLFRFYNRFSFDQQINDHRQRRLFYSWDYHNNTVSKPLQSISGGVGYESLFKL